MPIPTTWLTGPLSTVYLCQELIGYEDLHVTGGSVTQYDGEKIPQRLQAPLCINGFSDVIVSGAYKKGRSAHFWHDGVIYKQKGIDLNSGKSFSRRIGREQPLGTISSRGVDRELQGNGAIYEQYQEYGFEGPLKPIAKVEFDLPFTPTSNVCGAIFKSKGDTRLHPVLTYGTNMHAKDGNQSALELKAALVPWLGFSFKVLCECGILPDFQNTLNNFVFYKVSDGYGLASVDHDFSKFCASQREIRSQSIETLKELSFYLRMEEFRLREKFMEALNGKIPEPIDESLVSDSLPKILNHPLG